MPTGQPKNPGPPCIDCGVILFRRTKHNLCSRCYDRRWAERKRRFMRSEERAVYLERMKSRQKKTIANESPRERTKRLAKAKIRRLRRAEAYALTSAIWAKDHPKQNKAIKKRYSDRQADVRFRRGSIVSYDPTPVRSRRKDHVEVRERARIIATEKSRCYVMQLLTLNKGERVYEWVSYRRLQLIWQAPPDPRPTDWVI
jgi:hypothetical protein